MVVLQGARVRLRPGVPGDAAALVGIRREPVIRARWGGDDIAAEVAEGFIGTVVGFVIEVGGEVVGAIQYGEEDDPMYRHASIDLFLATARHGQGLGPEAIHLLACHLFVARGHHRLVIDPAADNAAAIRAYAKVGFRPVGRMRRYERGPDGTWHDGLLMDLLREEYEGAGSGVSSVAAE